jgi:hypothetical protein
MKTLKFNHGYAQEIAKGAKTSTWRLFDDKDLSVNDHIKVIDKINEDNPASWQVIGEAVVSQITEKKLGDVTDEDMAGHEIYPSQDEMLQVYRQRYGDRVSLDEPVKIIYFKFTPETGNVPTQAMLLEEAKL